MPSPEPSSSARDVEAEHQSAMVMTAREWISLAFVAKTFIEDYPNAGLDCLDICRRIVEASK